MRKMFLFYCILAIAVSWSRAGEKRLAQIQVEAGNFPRLDTPVAISLEEVRFNPDQGMLQLYEIQGKKRLPTPCQIEPGHAPRLCWILSGETPLGASRTFDLMLSDSTQIPTTIRAILEEHVLRIEQNGAPVLDYRHAAFDPPEGVSALFRREGGFIHPLRSPNGAILSAIQPRDHYHHLGIWNPWTKTRFEGRAVDFWNLGGGQATVRFDGFLSRTEGPVFGGFKARQEHVDFSAVGPDKTALHEVWDVRVWNVSTENRVWLWELTTTLSCATDSVVLLEAYRYGGGIGFRATEEWTRENCRVLTSAGKTRVDADGSRARWCDVSGATALGRSGVLFLSYPANREHPEPMRVWPEDANGGRGDLFFEFCPIRHKSWKLVPGQDYVLKYRMVVYDGEMSPQTAERYWNDFAVPPRVTWKKIFQ